MEYKRGQILREVSFVTKSTKWQLISFLRTIESSEIQGKREWEQLDPLNTRVILISLNKGLVVFKKLLLLLKFKRFTKLNTKLFSVIYNESLFNYGIFLRENECGNNLKFLLTTRRYTRSVQKIRGLFELRGFRRIRLVSLGSYRSTD